MKLTRPQPGDEWTYAEYLIEIAQEIAAQLAEFNERERTRNQILAAHTRQVMLEAVDEYERTTAPAPASDPQPSPYPEARPAGDAPELAEQVHSVMTATVDSVGVNAFFGKNPAAPQATPDAVTEALDAQFIEETGNTLAWCRRTKGSQDACRRAMHAALTAFSKRVSETAARIVEGYALGSVGRQQRKQYVDGVLAATFAELLPDKERE